jgi:hypothetical protein
VSATAKLSRYLHELDLTRIDDSSLQIVIVCDSFAKIQCATRNDPSKAGKKDLLKA